MANFGNQVRRVMSASAKGNFLLLNAFSLVLRPTHISTKLWVKWVLRLLGEPDQFKVKDFFQKEGATLETDGKVWPESSAC